MEFLTSIASNPIYEPYVQDMTHYYNEKLWHELTQILSKIILLPSLRKDQEILNLYNNFVSTFASSINPLNLALIISSAASQYPEPSKSLEFVRKAIDTHLLPESSDAHLYIRLVECHYLLLVAQKQKPTNKTSPPELKPLSSVPKTAVNNTADLVAEKLFQETIITPKSMWDFAPYLRDGENYEIPGGPELFQSPNSELSVELPESFDFKKYETSKKACPAANWNIPRNKWMDRIISKLDPEPERIAAQELTKLQPLFEGWEVPLKQLETTRVADLIDEEDPTTRFDTAYEILLDCEKEYSSRAKMAPIVSAKFHEVWSRYHILLNHPAEFYKSTMSRLEHDDLSGLSDTEKKSLAFQMAKSALIGHEVFNIGALLASGILKNLNGTEFQVLNSIVSAFAQGNIAEFNKLTANQSAVISQVTSRPSEVVYCKKKLSILAFVELCFRLDATERCISFKTVAEHCQIPVESVEKLVIHTIESGLIRGRIDQISQNINVFWVIPRRLDSEQLLHLQKKIVDWSDRVDKILTVFENQVAGTHINSVTRQSEAS